MKIILLIALIFLASACGGGSSEPAPQDDAAPPTAEPGAGSGDQDPVVENPTPTEPGTTTDGSVPEDNNSQAPAEAPQNLVGIAYTETEIGLFWDRPSVDSPAVTFRVYRDGVLLVTRDDLSFVESNLTPDTEYTYSVEPVKANGELGPQSSITLTTKVARPTINTDNAQQVLAYLHTVIAGDPFDEMRNLADTLYTIGVAGPRGSTETEPRPTAQGLTLVTSSFNDGVEVYSTNCELGGQYVFTYVNSTTPDGSGKLDNCALANVNQGNPIWGEYALSEELSKFLSNIGIVSDYTFANFRAMNERMRLRELNGRLFLGANGSAKSWTVSRFVGQQFEGNTIVVDAAISTVRVATDSADVQEYTREANFQVQAPETANKIVYVKTSVPFVRNNPDANFAFGTLEITSTDGSSMTMNADNGDANTFDLSITAEESTTSQTLPWTTL